MTERILITFSEDGAIRGIAKWDFGGLAIPVSASDLSVFGPEINAGLLARIEELEAAGAKALARIDEITAERDSFAADVESTTATLANREQTIATLEAELATVRAALAAATTAAETPDILATLDEAFETHVPEGLRAQFEPTWVTVRNLLQAGKIGRAAAFVRALPVPAELEAAREQIASMIDGGA